MPVIDDRTMHELGSITQDFSSAAVVERHRVSVVSIDNDAFDESCESGAVRENIHESEHILHPAGTRCRDKNLEYIAIFIKRTCRSRGLARICGLS